jgi:hypothetical protein
LTSADIQVVVAEQGSSLEPVLLGIASPYLARQIDLHDPHDLLDLQAAYLLGQSARSHPTDALLVRAT